MSCLIAWQGKMGNWEWSVILEFTMKQIIQEYDKTGLMIHWKYSSLFIQMKTRYSPWSLYYHFFLGHLVIYCNGLFNTEEIEVSVPEETDDDAVVVRKENTVQNIPSDTRSPYRIVCKKVRNLGCFMKDDTHSYPRQTREEIVIGLPYS